MKRAFLIISLLFLSNPSFASDIETLDGKSEIATPSAEGSINAQSSLTDYYYFLSPGQSQLNFSAYRKETKSDAWVPATQTIERRDYLEKETTNGYQLEYARGLGLGADASMTFSYMLSIGSTFGNDVLDYDRERLIDNAVVRRIGQFKQSGLSDISIGLNRIENLAANVKIQFGLKAWISPEARKLPDSQGLVGNRFSGGNSINPSLVFEVNNGATDFAVGVSYLHKLESKSTYTADGSDFTAFQNGGHVTTLTGVVERSISKSKLGVAGDYEVVTAKSQKNFEFGDVEEFQFEGFTSWGLTGFGSLAVAESTDLIGKIRYSQLENRVLDGFKIQQDNATDISLSLRAAF